VHPFHVTTSLLEQIQPPASPGRVWLFAIGKAAHGMATGLTHWLRASGRAIHRGLVVSTNLPAERLPALEYVVGDHPVPGEQSFAAAAKVSRLASEVQAGDQVYVLISGGTSSLIGAPLGGISESEYRSTFETLLASGIDITAMNAVRKQRSRWADGRLAAALQHASVQPVIMSDVMTNDPATIGSGPCHPESETAAAHVAPALIARHDLTVRAARNAALPYGLPVQTAPDMRGEARETGRALARHLVTLSLAVSQRRIVVCGGETTVTLGDSYGLGGRCQELALSAAEELARTPAANITLLAAGTDGRDGPTDAAGAVIDANTWQSLVDAGSNPAEALAGHDAYTALNALGALVRTGPTGTNMLDLGIAVVHPVKHLAP
jgi:hydroxypyruvate reductase